MKKKKNKINKAILKKQFIFIGYNLLAFLLTFIVLGVAMVLAVDKLFYQETKKNLDSYGKTISENIGQTTNGYVIPEKTKDERLLVFLYEIVGSTGEHFIYKRYYDARIIDYLINENTSVAINNESNINQAIDDSNNEQIVPLSNQILLSSGEEIHSSLNELQTPYHWSNYGIFPDEESFNEFIESSLSDDAFKLDLTILNKKEFVHYQNYDFIVYTIPITNSHPTFSSLKYAQLMVNIDGEVNARSHLIQIYFTAILIIMFMSIVTSYLLSRKSIKPIAEVLDKQLLFVSDASHELRMPLAIVRSKLENILTQSDKTVYDVSENIAIALSEVARLSKLTSELLTIAKTDNQTLQLNFTEFDFNDLINQVVEPFKEIAAVQEKKFEVQSESIAFYGDTQKMEQLLIILLDNAIRYTNENDSISIITYETIDDIFCEIKDTGIGVTPQVKKNMFERFYRGDKARSQQTGGNGLGLSIAKNIVEAHQGRIWVEDNKPKGTILKMRFPKDILQ
ncbi:MAG: sensor histidine kinase [Bacilli bacterium]